MSSGHSAIKSYITSDVMPLIYNSLDCEHLPVQEKALKTVPHLCEILDYGTVQNVLLVKVAVGLSPPVECFN